MAGEMWQLAKTPLGEAIVEGDPRTVKTLIEKGEDVFLIDRKNNTYLHYLCTMYRPYVFNILTAAGVPINTQNKHGNTALHVSALHSECCHVPDLMQCGIDPYITNQDGKLASDLAKNNERWLDLYGKYEPTLRVAVKNHDIEAMKYLFECWSAVHLPMDIHNNFNMRQFAAALTFHDLVTVIDQIRFTLMAVFSIKELNYERLEYALSRGREICDVNFLQRVRGGHPHHMLQHAIRLKEYKMVDMLLEAGADVNVPVHIHEYVRGPLFFEVIRNDKGMDMEMIRHILRADVDVDARDERGRTSLLYCIDRRTGEATIEMIETLLEKGVNIALRDKTGCTAREVALFARRDDIVAAIDQYFVEIIRTSDLVTLRKLAMHGYEDIFLDFMYRDTWIYAAGNETDEVTEYLKTIQQYWTDAKSLHKHISGGDLEAVHHLLSEARDVDMLLGYRDKAGRGPLLKAVLYNHFPMVKYLLEIDPLIADREKDNLERTALHYAYGLGDDRQTYIDLLRNNIKNQGIIDSTGCSPENVPEEYPSFTFTEKTRDYGMDKEVHCIKKYVLLLAVIRSKTENLKHFDKILRTLKYPVADFYDMFHPKGHPLVTDYRDLLLAAIDHRKVDIARKLVHCGVDCSVKQLYHDADGGEVWMAAADRAAAKGLDHLKQYILKKGQNSIY